MAQVGTASLSSASTTSIPAIAEQLNSADNDTVQMQEGSEELVCAMKEVARCEGLSSEEKSRIMQCLRNTHINRKRPADSLHTRKSVSSFTSHNKRSRARSLEADRLETDVCAYPYVQHPFINLFKVLFTLEPNRRNQGHGEEPEHEEASTPAQRGLVAPSLHIRADASVVPRSKGPFFTLHEIDPSYHSENVLGCSHYTRGAKLLAPCCAHLYVCRLCHDEQCHHALDRSVCARVSAIRICSTRSISQVQCI
jgi:hypothetical protein